MSDSSPRVAEHPIDPQFISRWSPRAFTSEEITEPALLAILEAARWAPSAYNAQPWRFVFARRGTPQWTTLLGLLNDFNRSWAENASALVIVLSKTTFAAPGTTEEKPFPTHSFDAGSAWGYLALQATLSGWHTHGMAGFDKEKTRHDLAIPADFAIEAAIAIGKIGDKTTLPAGLQGREAPSPRLPLSALVSEGVFQA
ncbi:nitroreductase family protein [Glaciimonas sp. PCH181]|uniref:nitroreductase family protein n=1 Tax=Glaciimonas sp. PCH181 TaxID=2133943 RepID=UPI000D3637E3|nr:nitroreductase family protein [Glaciimonas sp. PCH181]PUA17956.1 nitroreductase family protein [Glaciimonas sp. PCH181]